MDDLRDLQVWHKLVWVDPLYFERDERVSALVAKGRGFSEEDKLVLRGVELEILQRVVPEYRAASARGQVELSTSPFYHPILPLLCDTDIYLRTHPQSRMPRERFRHPEDAAEQLTLAVALHERLFGRKPDGLWPSEGSVSDDMVPLVARAGFRWMATDEGILSRTLGLPFARTADGHVDQPELLYRAYRVGQPTASVAIGFRDHLLSDLIGFSYAAWSADGAADDFVRRLVEAGRRTPRSAGGEEPTIFVILDGENAWEHYDRQGRPFLRALYQRLGSHPELTTVTMAEACGTAHEPLRSIFPGSWINSDFYIWIGHPDDHRAWTQLAEARRALETPPPGLAAESLAQAREEMLIAEGSDWFWWYGDDHSSGHDVEFDELFRRHVRNIYRALDKPIPEDLFVTNITTQPPGVEIHRPTGFIEPSIDGEVTSYFEWVGAGCADETVAAGAMHQVADPGSGVTLIEFGFDLDRLFIRVDGSRPMGELLGQGVDLSINFLKPPGVRFLVRLDAHGRPSVKLVERGKAGTWDERECGSIKGAVRAIVELEVPFRCLQVRTHDPVAFIVALNRDGAEVERYPRHRAIELDVPDRHFAALNWTA